MDLSVLQSGLDVTSGRGTVLANMAHQVEAGPKPVVAAAAGACLGAALELCLACAARLASPDAQLGLPEVRLGLLPGLGGTLRLPRLVGLQPALGLITAGTIVDAGKALELGLVDEVVPDRAQLIPRARELAATLAGTGCPPAGGPHPATLPRAPSASCAAALQGVLSGQRGQSPWRSTLSPPLPITTPGSPEHPLACRPALRGRADMLPAPEQARAMFKEARALASASWAQPRSVLLCIDAVEAGVQQGPEAGEGLVRE